ncbi:hypothetical protein D9M71_274950 [compost metagenome]
MGEVAKFRALVQRSNGICTERTEAHRRDIEDRCRVRLAALRAADVDAKRGRVGCFYRQHGVADELEAWPVDIVEGAKGLLGAFILGPRVHQRALGPGKRQLVVIALEQVLTNLRADGFDQVTDVAEDRVVAPYCVVALAQVIEADQAEQRADQGQRP